jgi:hypothetical protein
VRVVALREQSAHGGADPAAEIEDRGAGRKVQAEPSGREAQVALRRARVIGGGGIGDLVARGQRVGVGGLCHQLRTGVVEPGSCR